MAKFFNLSVALIFIAIGILGVFFPEFLAKFYGFTLQSFQAKTELRAISGLSLGVGYLLLHFSWVLEKQAVVLAAVAVLTFSYIMPRIWGLMIDGFDQPMMHKELGFECVVLVITLYLYRREVKKDR